MSSPLRITTWPGLQIDVPPVLAYEATVEDRSGALGGPYLLLRARGEYASDGFHPDLIFPPEELYLREVPDLDVTDADAMARFCSMYGRLGSKDWGELHPDRPPVTSDFDSRRHWFSEVMAKREGGDAWTRKYSIQPLDEAAMYIGLVRNMTRVWQHYTGHLALGDLVEQWEGPPLYSDGLLRPPTHTREALVYLVENLGHALPAIHARAILEVQGANYTRVEDWGAGDSSLFGGLCLQLLNHITENAQYRRCQKCGRLFVRQQGRAQKGQHRTEGELLYCDTYHARAAAQAAYRKRQADARRQEKEGSA